MPTLMSEPRNWDSDPLSCSRLELLKGPSARDRSWNELFKVLWLRALIEQAVANERDKIREFRVSQLHRGGYRRAESLDLACSVSSATRTGKHSIAHTTTLIRATVVEAPLG